MRHNTYIDKGHMHDDEDTNRNQWKKDTIKWAWTDEIEEIKNEKEKMRSIDWDWRGDRKKRTRC